MSHNQFLHISDPVYRKKAIGILILCLVMQAIPFGVAQNIQPLFIPYVTKAYGVSLTAFAVVFTIGAVSSAIFSPFIGSLYQKINVKLLFIGGILLTGLGFMGFAISKELPIIYAAAIITQLGCSTFSSIGVPFLIHHWFPASDAGKALGLAFAGGSIGNVFLQPITMELLSTKGPQFSYVVFGLLAIVVGLPLAILFVRVPNNKTLPVAGSNTPATPTPATNTAKTVVANTNESTVKTAAQEQTGSTIAEVRKLPSFWMFGIGYAIIGIGIAALSTQYAEYFRNGLHMDASLIGLLGSTFAIFCLIGNVGGGALFDKLGSFKTMFLACIFMVVAIVALLVAPKFNDIAFLFSIAYGLNVYSYMSGPAFMSGDVFGRTDYSQKLGAVNLFFFGGFASGSVIFSEVVKGFGFSKAWIVVLVATIVGYFLLLSAILKLKKDNL